MTAGPPAEFVEQVSFLPDVLLPPRAPIPQSTLPESPTSSKEDS